MCVLVWGLPDVSEHSAEGRGGLWSPCCLAFVCLSVHCTWDAAQSPARGCKTRVNGEVGESSPAQAKEHLPGALPDPCWARHLPPALMSRCQREQGRPGDQACPWARGHRGALRSLRLLSCLLSPAWARRSITVETPRALSQPVPALPPPSRDLEPVAWPLCLSASSSARQ